MAKEKYKSKINYDYVAQNLKDLALNLFVYDNVPDIIDIHYLELQLMKEGKAALTFNKSYGYMGLKAQASQGLNIYGKPIHFNLLGENGFNIQGLKEGEDFILIKNTPQMRSLWSIIDEYAKRIVNTLQTLDIRTNAHKVPYIVATNPRNELSVKILTDKVLNNEMAVIGDKNFLDNEPIKAFDLKVDFINDKLQDQVNDLMGEILTIIGIDNNSIDKGERLIVDEVNANNDIINRNLYLMLDERVKAVERFNTLYGTNMSVKLRFENQVNSIHEDNEFMEDENDGDL